jgi:hypothetical protein
MVTIYVEDDSEDLGVFDFQPSGLDGRLGFGLRKAWRDCVRLKSIRCRFVSVIYLNILLIYKFKIKSSIA